MSLNSAARARFDAKNMSFYIKLCAAICAASVIAWFMIQGLLSSTNHLPNRFSATSTNQLDRPDILEKGADGLESFDELVRETTERDKDTRETTVKAASGLSNNSETDPENLRTESDSVQTATNRNNQPTRSDSDADMQASDNKPSGNINSTVNKTRSENPITSSAMTNDLEIKRPQKTVRALDMAFAPADGSRCSDPDAEIVSIGIDFRETSYAIKGQSLTNIDKLIQLYKKCDGGNILVLQNIAGLEGTEERLIQLRKDEVKYYLLQRRVPKDDMIFPDNL